MEQESTRAIMMVLAVATPLAGLTLLLASRAFARQAEQPMSPSLIRSGWVLIVVGPLNLLAWMAFNGWLDRTGYRSAAGYALAAVVFFVLGWSSGWFRRCFSGNRGKDDGGGDQ